MNLLNIFKRKPKQFFTSDLHFGHNNVIDYCKRPYLNLETMHKDLIEIWNKTVKKGDTIYVLGDFSLNKKWSKEILPLLHGDKILIPGNHDKCFKFLPKENTPSAIEGAERRYKKACDEYLSHGWKSIHQTLTLKLKDNTTVLLSHLPYKPKDGEKYDRRYLEMRPKDEGLILLHGHQHCVYRKKGRQIDVGIDGDLKIFSEDDIIKLIKDKRDYIETPITKFYKEKKDETNNPS